MRAYIFYGSSGDGNPYINICLRDAKVGLKIPLSEIPFGGVHLTLPEVEEGCILETFKNRNVTEYRGIALDAPSPPQFGLCPEGAPKNSVGFYGEAKKYEGTLRPADDPLVHREPNQNEDGTIGDTGRFL